MKARDGVERRAAGTARVQIIPGGRSQQRLVNYLGGRLIPPPIRAVENRERGAILRTERNRPLLGALALEPFGEVWRPRQRDEGRQARNFPAYFFDHLLDEGMAEGHASKPALTIGDRIEHRGGRSLGFD